MLLFYLSLPFYLKNSNFLYWMVLYHTQIYPDKISGRKNWYFWYNWKKCDFVCFGNVSIRYNINDCVHRRKSVGPRMGPWGTPVLTAYSKYLTWNFIRLKFVKKISMPNPVKSLGYIKCHSSSNCRPVKSPSNSIRYNCEKICSWLRRPRTILETRENA